jgi:outer membrane lipoprotein-sorting protein
MQVRRLASIVVACITMAGMAAAQGPKSPPQTPQNWNQTVTKEPDVSGQEFDAKQIALIQKVSAYFNQLGDMKGNFVQLSADNKRLRGKFYLKRPGQFRFEYNLPSKQIVISDGKYLVIQDLDLKTDDRWGLDQTPFRVLLRQDVDLMKDARILEVGESDDRIVIALQDKSPDTVGRIKLFLQKGPAVELKEWITTDAQGLDTRVELHDFAKVDNLDPKLFVPSSVYLQKLQ